jgi:hypothetical protein|nr:MAG TPA: hypothetical protein [Caudoviricetes sp.]
MFKFDVSNKMDEVKAMTKPLLDKAKKEPGTAMKIAAVGIGLLAFLKLSSSVSGLCDSIKESKSK